DVDELAAMHHGLLARIQGGHAEQQQQPDAASSIGNRAATPDDEFSAERARRQRMSIRERLGLE
ncbi:hypothetical protein LPJ61_004875, partial [Coemansia biformis]